MSPADRRVHVVVHGMVQGVGFRAFTLRSARRLGLVGWVRNRANGTVELEAEGGAGTVEELLAAVRNGPPSSEVTDLEVEEIAARGDERAFDVRF